MTILKSATVRGIQLCCLLAVGSAACFGAVLYTSPYASGDDYFSSDPGQLIASSFTIGAGGAVSEVSWNGEFASGSPDTSYNFYIFSNNSGAPGTVLDSGVLTPVITDEGATGAYGLEEYSFDATLPTSFTADAGVQYFFSVSTPLNTDFLWANGSGSTSFDYSGSGSTGPWTNDTESGDSQAFTLSGAGGGGTAPEPATYLLGGLSLAGIILRKTRRQAGRQPARNAKDGHPKRTV